MGYTDPGYFNRVFKKATGETPAEFRKAFDYKNRDRFTQNIMELLRDYHTRERNLGFYADKMNMSVKTLSKKVRNRMNISLGQLIRFELIQTAREMLSQEASVKDVSLQLGFEEPNHFSTFFKHHTGETPGDFRTKKYNL